MVSNITTEEEELQRDQEQDGNVTGKVKSEFCTSNTPCWILATHSVGTTLKVTDEVSDGMATVVPQQDDVHHHAVKATKIEQPDVLKEHVKI